MNPLNIKDMNRDQVNKLYEIVFQTDTNTWHLTWENLGPHIVYYNIGFESSSAWTWDGDIAFGYGDKEHLVAIARTIIRKATGLEYHMMPEES